MSLLAVLLLALPLRAAETLPPERLAALKSYFESPATDPRIFAELVPPGAVMTPDKLAPLRELAEKKIDFMIALTHDDATPRAVMRDTVATMRVMNERLGAALDPKVSEKLGLGFFWARNRPMETALEDARKTAKQLTYGASVVDLSAPGARAVETALEFEDERPVLGIFRPSNHEIVNAYAMGTGDVAWHAQALPQELRGDPDVAGYTFLMRRDGTFDFKGSGTLPAPITPAARRAILRHLGVRPTDERTFSWLARGAMWYFDWAVGRFLPF